MAVVVAETPIERLRGVVHEVTFHSDETGFFVARVLLDGQSETSTVVGATPVIQVGEQLSAQGRWGTSRYGRQFKASIVELSPPTMRAGIEKYLATAVAGVGPGCARNLVATFGEDVFSIIEHWPERLTEVKGLGKKRAASIVTAYQEQAAVRHIMVFLHQHGLGAANARKVYERWGDGAIDRIRHNPYLLCHIGGIGFATADTVARRLGIAPDSEYRIRAGVQHVLSEAVGQGSCGLPVATVLDQAGALLQVAASAVQAGIAAEVAAKTLRETEAAGIPCLFPPAIFEAERYLARRLRAQAAQPPTLPADSVDAAIVHAELELGLTLETQQREAVRQAVRHQVCVITGGPGTGKCVVAGTLVHTQAGLQRIETLLRQHPAADGQASLTVPVLTLRGWQPSSYFYNGGVKPVLRLVTTSGHELTGTAVHPVLVRTAQGPRWQPLTTVQPGDEVGVSVTNTVTPGHGLRVRLAYLAGALVGGNAAVGPVRPANGADVSQLRQLLQTQLGDSGQVRTGVAGPALHLHGTQSRGLLSHFGGAGGAVPAAVLTGGSRAWRAFLRGLWDSCGYAPQAARLTFRLANEQLAKEVQVLLGAVGLFATRRRGPRYWLVHLADQQALSYRELIGVPPGRPCYAGYAHCADDTAGASRWLHEALTLGPGLQPARWQHWPRPGARGRPCRLHEKTARGDTGAVAWGMSRVHWVPVRRVVAAGAQPVFDLTIPGPAHFIANGLVAHNTTLTRVLVNVLQAAGETLALCAPTGKAAKRLAEATGEPAKTIHRTLEVDATGGFRYGSEEPLPADTVLIDEMSMTDVPLFQHVLRALAPRTRLVLLGDVDQLPSVGPGKVLADIIASQALPVARLTEVFRQAQDSAIIRNAHRVNRGELPEAGYRPGSDFVYQNTFTAESANDMAAEVLRLTRELYRRGFDPIRDVQVLTPMRRGPLGVDALNDQLRQALNPDCPASVTWRDRVLGVGDKVMQLKNNYERQVFNGDIGFVTAVHAEAKRLTVLFDDRPVEYAFNELGQLALAYAITVHKSQGSEFPVVVLPVHTSHYMLLKRNLVYTGLTRARSLCLLLGVPWAVKQAVANDQVEERYSKLADWLRQADHRETAGSAAGD